MGTTPSFDFRSIYHENEFGDSRDFRDFAKLNNLGKFAMLKSIFGYGDNPRF